MRKFLVCSIMAAVLAGCATAPVGPRVAVMPAPGKPFEQFAAEDQICRHYAGQSIGSTPNDSAAQNFVGAAAVGTVIGAAAGAMSGGHGGNGAAAGLVVGSVVGANQSGYASRDAQRRYDITYEQCMYAKGNQIPGYQRQQQIFPPSPNTGYRQAAPYFPPPPPPPPR
jgi:uncharacterized protein YcfJ